MMIKRASLRGIYPNPRGVNGNFNVKSQDLVMHYNLDFINMQFRAKFKKFCDLS